MSGVERHFEQRSQTGPPTRCPVCWGNVLVKIDGRLTCSEQGRGHFEWVPAEQRGPAVVEGEVVSGDDPAPSCGSTELPHFTDCYSDPTEPAADADNLSYVKSLTMTNHQPEVEGGRSSDRSSVTITEAELDGTDRAEYRALCEKIDEVTFRRLNDPRVTSPWLFDVEASEGEPIRVTVTTYPTIPVDEPPATAPAAEPEVLGIDWNTVTAARLGGDAARLAQLHRPVKSRYGGAFCDGCDWGEYAEGPPDWPCTTAELVLGMMELTESDIAPSKE